MKSKFGSIIFYFSSVWHINVIRLKGSPYVLRKTIVLKILTIINYTCKVPWPVKLLSKVVLIRDEFLGFV